MDVVQKAIEKYIPILKIVEGNETYQGALRSRLRSLPQMLLDMGIMRTITFFAAKAELPNVKKALEIYEGGDFGEVKKEKAGYALALAMILKFLKEDMNMAVPEELNANEFLNFLRIQLQPKKREIGLRLFPFVVELKKLGEATLKEARGE